jgi:hypothetical protein
MPKRKRIARNRRVFAPYPELVDPARIGYQIIDNDEMESRGGGSVRLAQTNREQRMMAVPLSQAGAEISRHEIALAAWSPKKMPVLRTPLSRACLEAVEESRINYGLNKLGIPFQIPIEFGRTTMDCLMMEMMQGKMSAACVRAAAFQGCSLGTPMNDLITKMVEAKDENAIWLQSVMGRFQRKLKMASLRRLGKIPSFKQGRTIAKWLEKEILNIVKVEDQPQEQAKGVLVQMPGGAGKKIKKKKQTPLSQYYRAQNQSMGSMKWARHQASDWTPKETSFFGSRWGEGVPCPMHLHKPPLVIALKDPDLERATKARAADEGTEFRYMERFVVDQRVFKRRAKRRTGGGTVLLDVSSTMELSDAEVMEIVEGAIESTKVATYCGNGQKGRLSIIVDKGRRAVPEDVAARFGIGNNCDIHALDWLSVQPEPRVWFTDGGVTGQGHGRSQALRDVCNTIVRENNIIQVRTVADVCMALRREHTPERYIYDEKPESKSNWE